MVEYNNIDDKTVKDLGSKIRYDKEFEPRGINVNFYEEVLNSHEIDVKTYEKGVEDLMMSCGSGSVACISSIKTGQVESPVHVLQQRGNSSS